MSVATSLLENIKEAVTGGDPIFRQWFLMGSFPVVLMVISSYVIFVKFIGPAIMANRKPIKPIYVVFAYNFALVIFYLTFVLRGLFFLMKLRMAFFCGNLSHSQGPEVIKFFEMGHQLYMVKYIELLDTVFLVLSKKFDMITNLHVFHHAIVPLFGFVGFRTETNSYLTVFMGINSIIHIIMYAYYAIAILGPRYQKYLWWKKYLTLIQILQFLIVTVYIAIMSALGCAPSKVTLAFSTSLSVIFFFLFLNYYRRTFIKGDKKAELQSKNGYLPSQEHKSPILNGDVPSSKVSLPTSEDSLVNRKNVLKYVSESNKDSMDGKAKSQ